jgi:uncharacterized protein (TIGR02466 family)
MNRTIEIMFADAFISRNMSDTISNNLQIRNKCIKLMKSLPVKTDWYCNTFNSLDSLDLRLEPFFVPLIEVVSQEVNVFSNEFLIYPKAITCTGAWFNVSSSKDYQEFHNHAMSHFSAVYYVDVPEDSGMLVFHKTFSNMFPLPKPRSDKFLNNQTYKFVPKNQDLVIFRSDIYHMVTPNNTKDKRISISMNFVLE